MLSTMKQSMLPNLSTSFNMSTSKFELSRSPNMSTSSNPSSTKSNKSRTTCTPAPPRSTSSSNASPTLKPASPAPPLQNCTTPPPTAKANTSPPPPSYVLPQTSLQPGLLLPPRPQRRSNREHDFRPAQTRQRQLRARRDPRAHQHQPGREHPHHARRTPPCPALLVRANSHAEHYCGTNHTAPLEETGCPIAPAQSACFRLGRDDAAPGRYGNHDGGTCARGPGCDGGCVAQHDVGARQV